ncbi:MAG: 3-hydroxyacyl-CoA dehydrogenase, partial [Gammaproteobacteria bacterium]
MNIERVAVLGAGVMGAGIAAHLTNAGVDVVLLDIAGEGDDRNGPARRGLEAAKKADPA